MGNRMRIMGRQLRKNMPGSREESGGAGLKGQVGMMLLGEDRVVIEPELLSEFDFGVPVSTLDDTNH
jgi:hypothetical protein